MRQTGGSFLWGRVLAPTPDDDSFLVRVFTEAKEIVEPTMWSTGVHKQWEWTRVSLNAARGPEPLPLPAGLVNLQLRVREDGTQIDRLFLTASQDERPR